MIKLYIYFQFLSNGNVEVGPDIGLKFHQEVMEIVSYDIMAPLKNWSWPPGLQLETKQYICVYYIYIKGVKVFD